MAAAAAAPTAAEYEGVVFDRLEKPDMGMVVYMVYLTELKLLSRVSVLVGGGGGGCAALPQNYELRRFKIFVFEDKATLRQKIKLEMCGGAGAGAAGNIKY